MARNLCHATGTLWTIVYMVGLQASHLYCFVGKEQLLQQQKELLERYQTDTCIVRIIVTHAFSGHGQAGYSHV